MPKGSNAVKGKRGFQKSAKGKSAPTQKPEHADRILSLLTDGRGNLPEVGDGSDSNNVFDDSLSAIDKDLALARVEELMCEVASAYERGDLQGGNVQKAKLKIVMFLVGVSGNKTVESVDALCDAYKSSRLRKPGSVSKDNAGSADVSIAENRVRALVFEQFPQDGNESW